MTNNNSDSNADNAHVPQATRKRATRKRATRKRVLFLASYAPSLLNFRGKLIAQIIARGHEVICAAPDFDADTEAQLKALGAKPVTVALQRTGLNPLADLGVIARLYKLFRRERPDVVMGYTPKAAIYSAIAASAARVPHIVPLITGLGYAFADGDGLKTKLLSKISLGLYRQALRGAHAVIFQNRDDQALFEKHKLIGAHLDVHRVKGSGVDLTHFTPEPLRDTQDDITFLLIARLVRYKGVIEFAQAAAALAPRYPNAKFILIGPRDDTPSAMSEAEIAESSDHVTYLGSQKDVRSHIANCHVYVLPSYGEGMPRTVLEALALGRPVVTTRVNGCRETVEDGVNGYLVEARDADALAAGMSRFLDDPATIVSMGAASLKMAHRDFDVLKINAGMIEALGL